MDMRQLSQLSTELIAKVICYLNDPAPFTRTCRRIYEIASNPHVKAQFLLRLGNGCAEQAANYGLRYPFFDDNVLHILDVYWGRTLRQRSYIYENVINEGFSAFYRQHYLSTLTAPKGSDSNNKRTAYLADLAHHGYREDIPRVSLTSARLPRGMFHRRNKLTESRCQKRVNIYLTRGGSLADAAFVVALAAKYNWPQIIRMMFEFDKDEHVLLRDSTCSASMSDHHRVTSSNNGTKGKRRRINEQQQQLQQQQQHIQPTTPAELALVHCAREGQEEILDLLLSYQVRPCTEALTVALQRYRWPIVAKLVSAGVVPDMDTLDLMNRQMDLI